MKRNVFKVLRRNDLLTRLPFIAAVIGGGIILSILKQFHVNQLLVSFFAVLFIVIYAISVITVPVLRLREDQLGDNCYYLGFLYTLGSLVWALESFARSKNVDEIIANFGLALFSTIFGIMLRVVINQSRKDILETERECRIELASAVARMRSTIDEATDSLDSFCRNLQQKTNESISDNLDKSASAISACTNMMTSVTEKAMNGISSALESHAIQANKINTAVKSIENELYGISERLKNVEVNKNMIDTKLQPVANYIESSLTDLANTIVDHNNSLVDEIKRAKAITVDLVKTFTELAEYITEKVR